MTRYRSGSTAKAIAVIGGSVVAVLVLTVVCVFVISRSLSDRSDESLHVDQINDELRRKLDEFEVREESTHLPTKFSRATWNLAGSLIKDGYLRSDRNQLSFDAKTVSAAIAGRFSLLSPDSDPYSLKWMFAGLKERDKEAISSCLTCSTASGYRAGFYDRVQQEWDKVKPLLPADGFRRSQKMIILAASLHEMSSSEQGAHYRTGCVLTTNKTARFS